MALTHLRNCAIRSRDAPARSKGETPRATLQTNDLAWFVRHTVHVQGHVGIYGTLPPAVTITTH